MANSDSFSWPDAQVGPSPANCLWGSLPSARQILSDLVMDELLPTLQTDLLPKMKGKKNDRKRAWLGVSDDFVGQSCHSK